MKCSEEQDRGGVQGTAALIQLLLYVDKIAVWRQKLWLKFRSYLPQFPSC